MQHQHVGLERVGTGAVRRDLTQQPAHRLEQHEAVAIRRRDGVALQDQSDRWKAVAGEVGERERERGGSHCLGRNASSARTNSSVAST